MKWRRKRHVRKTGTRKPPDIAEKVRFWEEQDRINRILIPKVIRQHEVLKKLSKEHKNLPGLFSRQLALEEQLRRFEKERHELLVALKAQSRRFEKERKDLDLVRSHARRDRLLRWLVIGALVVSLTALVVSLRA